MSYINRNQGFILAILSINSLWAQERKPNVILIYTDDVGYGDVGCYGAQLVSTPHIDKLAKEGVRFTNAYAAAATSTPSRYAMLTGEYAFRRAGTDVAAGNAAMIIQANRFTLADLFRKVGYKTAAIGKWHLGLGSKTGEQDWNGKLDLSLADLGFEYSYIMAATGDRVPCVFIEQGKVANYDVEAPIQVSYSKAFEGEPIGRTHPELLTKLKHSHGHDMAIVNGIGRIGYMKGGGKALWQDEHIADSIASKALTFIANNAEQPFFLYLATNDIHVPRYPHPRFRGASSMGLRGDAIAQLDWTVGQVLDQLDRLNIRDNTLIIFSSDNGAVVDDGYQDGSEELLGTHQPTGGLRGNKYSAFEGGTRVPAIVSWLSSVPQGKISNALVSQIDWFRSLAMLLSYPIDNDVAPDSQNRLADWLYMSRNSISGRPWIIQQAANKTLSLRAGYWKYIEPSDGPAMIPWGAKVETGYNKEEQLYNLKNDPYERKNVASDYPNLVAELRSQLKRIKKDTTSN